MNRSTMSAVTSIFSGLLLTFSVLDTAHATIDGAATLNYVAQAGGVYNYTLTLTNNPDSTSNIETFWYSWVPGLDFMTTNPISVTAPTGWGIYVENGAYYGGFSIQFTTTTKDVTPGGSVQFQFSSLATPTDLSGSSPVFFDYYTENTSYLYSQSVESGSSEEIFVQTIPEPSTVSLVALGIVAAVFGIGCRRLRFRS